MCRVHCWVWIVLLESIRGWQINYDASDKGLVLHF